MLCGFLHFPGHGSKSQRQSEVVRTASRELQAGITGRKLAPGPGQAAEGTWKPLEGREPWSHLWCTTHMSPKQLSLRATCILVLLLTSQLCALRQASVPSGMPGTDQHLFAAFLSVLGQGEHWLGYSWERA